jgi:hypothetical protein
VIPSFGIPFGPVLVLVGVAIAFGVLVEILFFTALIDHPQLITRKHAAVAAVALGFVLALTALFAPYEGERQARCTGALAQYGFSTSALAAGGGDDACASAGQLLVVFGWSTPLMLGLIIGIWWWAGDS